MKNIAAIVRGYPLIVYIDSVATMLKLQGSTPWFKDEDIRVARLLGYIESNYVVGSHLLIKHVEGKDNILADLLSR